VTSSLRDFEKDIEGTNRQLEGALYGH
jgi:hypothetical protein